MINTHMDVHINHKEESQLYLKILEMNTYGFILSYFAREAQINLCLFGS